MMLGRYDGVTRPPTNHFDTGGPDYEAIKLNLQPESENWGRKTAIHPLAKGSGQALSMFCFLVVNSLNLV